MRKADVDIYEGLPSVNVKTDTYDWQRFAATIGPEMGYPDFTPEWCEEHVSEGLAQAIWEAACESGWELAQSDAEEVFGRDDGFGGHRVDVISAGRSGGHLLVRGLPDVEEWDAVMVAKWFKFARWARDTADTVPQVMAELVCLNDFDCWKQEQAAKAAQRAAAQLPVLLSV